MTKRLLHATIVTAVLTAVLMGAGCGAAQKKDENVNHCSSFEDACEAKGGYAYSLERAPGQRYHYYTTVADGSVFQLKLAHRVPNAEGSNYKLEVLTADRGTVVESFGAERGIEERRSFGVVRGATYYIKIWLGDASKENGYLLGLHYTDQPSEAEPNNDLVTANTITPGVDVRGGRNAGERYDIYAIKAVSPAATVRATVRIEHETANDQGSNYKAAIIRSDQTEIDSFEAMRGLDNGISFGMMANETYYVKVYVGESSAENHYFLRVDYDSEIAEIEPNNDYTSATLILPQHAAYGYLGRRNGGETNDFYTFAAVSGSTTVSLKHLVRNAGESNFYAEIIDSDQRTIDAFSATNGLDGAVTLGTIPGRDYFIRVYVGRTAAPYGYRLAVVSGR